MSRVVLVSPERIRARMAGVGVRYLEMARSLAGRGHEVTLLAPNEDLPEETAFRLATHAPGRFRELTRGAQALVVHGHVSNQLFREVEGIPTVVDLYDPFLVENLYYAQQMGEEVFLFDQATLLEQLRRGDFFLCFTPGQRLFYLGMLAALGRVNPQSFIEDRGLDRLVALLPFGIPRQEPARGTPQLRGVVEGIAPDDRLIFYGGIYDWHDPLTALRALEILDTGTAGPSEIAGGGGAGHGDAGAGPGDPAAERARRAPKLIFVRNPNPESTPQRGFAEAEAWCRERGWLGSRVFILDWIDYDRRESAYLECDLGLAAFPRGLLSMTFAQRQVWHAVPEYALCAANLATTLQKSGHSEERRSEQTTVTDAAALFRHLAVCRAAR